MEKGNDRISQLANAVLHYILSLMPMKFMIRTSVLSRRWSNLWKDIWAYSTVLDFGAEFAAGQTPEEFVSTVNQFLQLHKAMEIEMFRLSLIPCNMSYADKWVKFAGAKRAKEVDIHFCKYTYDDVCNLERLSYKLPRKLLNSIFNCDSITHLNLSGCNLRRRLNFKGYPYLKTLHLCMVGITNCKLESMLSNCPLIEELILRNCSGLTRVKVSAPNLTLKRLTVIETWYIREIEIFAPNLQSFHYYGNFISMYFKNILSLVDVVINVIHMEGCFTSEHDWMPVLHHLGHVKILTLCYVTLEYIDGADESASANLPVTFHNLQELQLLLKWSLFLNRANRNIFFKNCLCPCLEKLFIEVGSVVKSDPIYAYTSEDHIFHDVICDRLPSSNEHPSIYYQHKRLPGEDPLDIVFDHLKVIKMTRFTGIGLQMQLVKFFLEKAIVLESLVMVAPQNGVCKMKKDFTLESQFVDEPLRLLRERLLILAKASSSNARIVICEYSDDDGTLVPTHTDFRRRWCLSPDTC